MSNQNHNSINEDDFCNALLAYVGKNLECTVKGVIDTTLLLEHVQVVVTHNVIYLYDTGVNEYRFEIYKDTIKEYNIEDDMFKVKLIDDGLTTYLHFETG